MFLGDDSCTSGQDDLLAVQAAPGVLPAAMLGDLAVVHARDLVLEAPDVTQARAQLHCCRVLLLAPNTARGGAESAAC